ncbi:MAG: NAD+ synthase [Anaerolineae bacterium]
MESTADLRLDVEATRRTIVAFIHEQLSAAGFRRAVLGLSGGIDSALVCYLAAEALGADNVLAVTMPYASSSPQSLDDALQVVAATGVRRQHFEITPVVEPLFAALPDMDRRRRGNAMARARMIVLYDHSEAFQGLVLGTGNKTEVLLGYSTLHGDSACAIAPIADLYKTQVRQLAAAVGVPESVRLKPPTADLWPGQTDEGEIGLSYAEADAILYLLFERGLAPQEVVARGHAEAKVQRVRTMVQRSQYKRCPAPIARVSACCVGAEIPTARTHHFWPDL